MLRLSKADRQWIEKWRGEYDPTARWYAVMTHAGRERRVRDRIFEQFGPEHGEILLPEVEDARLRRQGAPAPMRMLFSSYIFWKCPMNDEFYMTVSEFRDVLQINSRAFRIPSPIDEGEMTRFRRILTENFMPKLRSRRGRGERVLIVDGCLKGTEGRLISLSGSEARIEIGLSFLSAGDSMVIKVRRELVALAERESGEMAAPELLCAASF